MSNLRVTAIPAADRIRAGLTSVHDGVTESRARIERLTIEREAERAALVDTRYRLRSEASAIERALSGRARVLAAGETEGPRARERDGARLEVDGRGVTPIDAVTAGSLAAYGLRREGDAPRGLDSTTAWRRILGVR